MHLCMFVCLLILGYAVLSIFWYELVKELVKAFKPYFDCPFQAFHFLRKHAGAAIASAAQAMIIPDFFAQVAGICVRRIAHSFKYVIEHDFASNRAVATGLLKTIWR